MKKFSIAFLLIISLFFSCGKEESLTKTELFTKAPWMLTSSRFDPPLPTQSGSIVNRMAGWAECELDDLYYYLPSGTYKITEGPTKCGESDYDVLDIGIWAFNEQETKLYTGIFDYLNEYDILQLDGNELKLRLFFADTLSNVYSLTETFKHP